MLQYFAIFRESPVEMVLTNRFATALFRQENHRKFIFYKLNKIKKKKKKILFIVNKRLEI